jgi:hypothetical protein
VVQAFPLEPALKNENRKPIEQITGFLTPPALAIDDSGNLFAADALARTVYKFKPRHIQPYDRYYRGLSAPSGVAVASDGTLYVLNAGSRPSSSTIVEYAPTKHAPTHILTKFDGTPSCLTLDGQNNLYVGLTVSNGVGGVEKFAPGAMTGTNLKLLGAPQPSGIVVDQSGDIVLSGAVKSAYNARAILPTIAFYRAASTAPSYQGAPPLPSGMALTQDESAIVAGSDQAMGFVYQYGPSADFSPLGMIVSSDGAVSAVAISPRDPG